MKVVVYSKSNCPACDVVKRKLTQRGVKFEEVKVDEDTASRHWLLEQGHRSVPQVYVGGVLTNPDAIVAEDFIE